MKINPLGYARGKGRPRKKQTYEQRLRKNRDSRAMKRRAKKPPKKTGRPTLYDDDEHPKIARKVIGEGRTLGDLAKILGVSDFTVAKWRTDHVNFSGHIELGREDATDAVERALHKRATGYEHQEEKLVVVSGGPGAGSVVERHKITVPVLPDPTSIKFWLVNRRKKLWADRSHQTFDGTLTMEQMLLQSWTKADDDKVSENKPEENKSEEYKPDPAE